MVKELTGKQRKAFTRINRELDRAINHLITASHEADKADLDPVSSALAVMLRMGKLLDIIICEITGESYDDHLKH